MSRTTATELGRATAPPRLGRFAAALRSARDAAVRRAAAAVPPSVDPPLTLRRSATIRADATLRTRREVFSGEERQAPAAATAPLASVAHPPDPPPTSELRAIVRALPPAIEASRVRDGAPLTLAFGRSLCVDVRAGVRGVEVLLRPEPRLARAAQAELPALVEALRARGIRVARAGVLARPDAGPAAVRAR